MTRSITANDLWTLPRVGDPVANGGIVVVPVTRFDLDDNKATTSLYLLTPGEPKLLTNPKHDAKSPAIALDGARIAFVRSESPDEPAQLYVMPLDGGEAECLTDMPLGVLGPKWMPDGDGLLFLSPLFTEAPTIEDTRKLRDRREDAKVKAHVTEDRLYRYWDRWLTDGSVPHIFLFDFASREIRDLIPDSQRWWSWDQEADSYDVSPDGREVAFSADTSAPPHDRPRTAVFTTPVAGGATRCLTPDGTGHELRPRYSPDGTLIVYGMQREIDYYADRVRLVRYDRQPDEHHVLTEAWDRSASSWEFTAQGDLVFTAEDRARVNLYQMPPKDVEPRQIARGGTFGHPVPGTDTLFATLQDLSHPPEVVSVDISGSQRLTHFTEESMADLRLGNVEEITFEGADGDPIQAFVVYPPDFDPARRWPLVHMIHGGPHGIFGDTFHFRWNAHTFAAPGYVVALVNFHGSTSWGQDFATSIQGAWGDLPTQDILSATDHLLERGFLDEDRMAIAGGSYGGYLTTWLTTQTDRFACAVAHAAVTDLPGMYASDVTMGRIRSYGADYWEDPDTVDRWNPARHTAGCRTPTLVIAGERDFRVPSTQGLEFYGILKAKGVEARLVYYPDENHWILKPQNSLHWYQEVQTWLARHLDRASTSS
ncbi:MAG: prolyl oligopeptidase family serine peptidase [Gammaproteobacteria bacterium]|nr:prolyl oligopeptidase family serine peptidase [Gammaproteobacteria bacterium]